MLINDQWLWGSCWYVTQICQNLYAGIIWSARVSSKRTLEVLEEIGFMQNRAVFAARLFADEEVLRRSHLSRRPWQLFKLLAPLQQEEKEKEMEEKKEEKKEEEKEEKEEKGEKEEKEEKKEEEED